MAAELSPHLERLLCYLDQEQTADERQSFEEHLETCEACRQALAQVRSYRAALQQAGPESEPDERWADIEDAVIAEISAGPRAGSGRVGRAVRVVVAVGAVAAAAAAALVLFGERIDISESGCSGGEPSQVGPAMRVAAVSGAIEARDAAGRVVKVAPGTALGQGTRLVLDAGAELMLELEGGGMRAHTLGPGRLRVHAARPELARIDLFQGDVVLRVEGPWRPAIMEVGTPDGMVTVIGTVFGVQHRDQSGSAVAVLRGEVRVTPAMDNDVHVKAGFKLSVRDRRVARIEPAEWSRLGRRVGLAAPAPDFVPGKKADRRKAGSAHAGPEPASDAAPSDGEPAPTAEDPAVPPAEEPAKTPSQRERELQQFIEQGEEYQQDLDR